MSYVATFIQVAADCPVEYGVVPISKKEAKPAHIIQYELLKEHPYFYNHEELLFQVYLLHKGIPLDQSGDILRQIREDLFKKSHPCLRASQLPKKYGWGVHYNEVGRIAIYGKETPEYRDFLEQAGNKLTLLKAMRNKRVATS
ncbi:DUF6157 family protein [Paenibacillus agricola]|uniref:DUF6157 family protein n=1 Tax=Paenibacillus agricola TaxID=2716264 RepID=UPI001FB683EB|nr:DUF6157 family protein [Paenibacillus agricola]